MTAWIRFKVEVEDGDGDVVRVDMVMSQSVSTGCILPPGNPQGNF